MNDFPHHNSTPPQEESWTPGSPGAKRTSSDGVSEGDTGDSPGRDTTHQLLVEILRHREMGFAILPVWGTDDTGECRCPTADRADDHKPGKHPRAEHGFRDATRDEVVIRRWFATRSHNYGLVWPEDSDRVVFVMDIDGADWKERIEALARDHGELPQTKTTRTPNGLHFFFEWPAEAGEHPTGNLFGFVTRWPWKGYVVGPGSRIGDKEYRDAGGGTATLPLAWARAAQGAAREQPSTRVGGEAKVPEGQRHTYLRDRARALLAQGLTGESLFQAVMALNIKYCDPPKAEAGIRRAIGAVAEKFVAGARTGDPEGDEWIRHFGRPLVILDDVPDAAFHGPIGEIARIAGRHTEAPPLAVLVTGLTLFSGMIGRGARILDGATSTNAQVFALLVGLTGSGKGLSLSVLDRVMEQMPSHDPTTLLTDLNSGEGLIAALLATGTLPDGSTPARVVIEEFAALLRTKRKDGQTLGQTVRRVYDARALTRTVAAGKRIVPKPAVSFLAHVTPEELLRETQHVDVASGFLNRFLLVPVRKRTPEEPGIQPDFADLAARLEAAVVNARGLDAQVIVTPDAAVLLQRVRGWQLEASRSPGLVGAMLERIEQHLRRMAVAYCLSRLQAPAPPILTAEDVLAATAVASASVDVVVAMWGDRPASPRHAVILDRVRDAGQEGMTPSRLLQSANGAYREKLRELIAGMIDEGSLMQAKAPGKGYRIHLGMTPRPRSLWRAVTGDDPIRTRTRGGVD